jgi:hypothetical protein
LERNLGVHHRQMREDSQLEVRCKLGGGLCMPTSRSLLCPTPPRCKQRCSRQDAPRGPPAPCVAHHLLPLGSRLQRAQVMHYTFQFAIFCYGKKIPWRLHWPISGETLGGSGHEHAVKLGSTCMVGLNEHAHGSLERRSALIVGTARSHRNATYPLCERDP